MVMPGADLVAVVMAHHVMIHVIVMAHRFVVARGVTAMIVDGLRDSGAGDSGSGRERGDESKLQGVILRDGVFHGWSIR